VVLSEKSLVLFISFFHPRFLTGGIVLRSLSLIACISLLHLSFFTKISLSTYVCVPFTYSLVETFSRLGIRYLNNSSLCRTPPSPTCDSDVPDPLSLQKIGFLLAMGPPPKRLSNTVGPSLARVSRLFLSLPPHLSSFFAEVMTEHKGPEKDSQPPISTSLDAASSIYLRRKSHPCPSHHSSIFSSSPLSFCD